MDVFNDFSEKEFLEDLESLVNIDSGSHDIEGLNQVAGWLAKKYEEAGLQTVITRHGPQARPLIAAAGGLDAGVFAGELPADEEQEGVYFDLLFIGHIDTVFPKGTVARRPFLRQGNMLLGPGAADMKSGVLLAFYLTRALLKRYPQMKICIANNSDEEIGTVDCQARLKELACRSSFCMDMEPGRIDGSFVSQRKGAADYKISFHGIASHAGNEPEKGASAIGEMGYWIEKLKKIDGMEEGITVNVGLVSGGTASNVVADYAEAVVDVRYFTMEQLEKVDRAFRDLAQSPSTKGVQVAVRRLNQSPPMESSEKTLRWLAVLKEEGQKLGQDVNFLSVGGSSDANLISLTGIPVLDGCGPQGDGYHSEKEYILLDSAARRFQLLFRTISRVMEEESRSAEAKRKI